MSFSWIQEVLSCHYPQASWPDGVDLDLDGSVEETEKLQDVDHDGVLGSGSDWEKFFQDNKTALQTRIPFFASTTDVSLKGDNPLHDVLAIESEIASPQQVAAVYQLVSSLVAQVREVEDASALSSAVSPETQNPHAWEIVLIYDLLVEKGIAIINQDKRLLTQNVEDNQLDCDSSSLVVMAVAHELGYSLVPVMAPEHVFLRWNGDGEGFNIDCGVIRQNNFYLEKYGFEEGEKPVANGILLSSLSTDETAGLIFCNRASTKYRKGDLQGATIDYSRAIELNPEFVEALWARGQIKHVMGDLDGAIADYDRAIELNPKCAGAFFGRGTTKDSQGDWNGAIADYVKASELNINPEYADAFHVLGIIKKHQGDLDSAIAYYDRAIALDPGNTDIFYNRGHAKEAKGDLEGAIVDYSRVIELDPEYTDCLQPRIDFLKQKTQRKLYKTKKQLHYYRDKDRS